VPLPAHTYPIPVISLPLSALAPPPQTCHHTAPSHPLNQYLSPPSPACPYPAHACHYNAPAHSHPAHTFLHHACVFFTQSIPVITPPMSTLGYSEFYKHFEICYTSCSFELENVIQYKTILEKPFFFILWRFYIIFIFVSKNW
jgi:hypothetical protein